MCKDNVKQYRPKEIKQKILEDFPTQEGKDLSNTDSNAGWRAQAPRPEPNCSWLSTNSLFVTDGLFVTDVTDALSLVYDFLWLFLLISC